MSDLNRKCKLSPAIIVGLVGCLAAWLLGEDNFSSVFKFRNLIAYSKAALMQLLRMIIEYKKNGRTNKLKLDLDIHTMKALKSNVV